MLSQLTGIPALFVRKEAKTYGTCQLAEGGVIDGTRLTVVEDVVTSGGQVITSCGDLRDRGAIVEHALCVIDRESGGPAGLADIGVELRPLFTMTELKAAARARAEPGRRCERHRRPRQGGVAGRVEVAGPHLAVDGGERELAPTVDAGHRPGQVVPVEEPDRPGLERVAVQLAADHPAVEQQRVERQPGEAEAQAVEHRDERRAAPPRCRSPRRPP